MKKILLGLFIVAALVIPALSAAPTHAAVDAGYIWECVDTSTAVVSVTGADSATVCTFNAVAGYQYILKTLDSVAAAADSVQYKAQAYARNGSTFCEVVLSGTVYTAANGTWSLNIIPTGSTLLANKIRIKAYRQNATNVTKTKKWELWRRIPVVYGSQIRAKN